MSARNQNWKMNPDLNGLYSLDQAQLGVLMDIRDELKTLNKLLNCSNFTSFPSILRQIRQYTSRIRARPRKKKK